MSIVIVDDSITHLVVLKHLAGSHYSGRIETFSDTKKAKQHLEQGRAELVILDCEMPGMNGVQFASFLRSLPSHATTPIVMVTNHTDDEIRLKALQAGVTDFLSKPVKSEEFKMRLRNLISMQSQARELC